MQGTVLRVGVKQVVTDRLGVSAGGEFTQERRPAASLVEPLDERFRIGHLGEGVEQRDQLRGDPVVRMGQQIPELPADDIVGGLVRLAARPGGLLGEVRFKDVSRIPA